MGKRKKFTLTLAVRGTDFQRAVWAQLLAIPCGESRSYAQIAQAIGQPTAVRAVARANGDNYRAIVIPCHRVMGSDGTSLRINVDDGKATVDGRLKYAETDAMKGKTPKIGLGAYTNSFAGTKETALYDIDLATATLVKQAPPNDGILNTVGPLGIKLDGGAAFDISSDDKGGNSAWLLVGNVLHSVDLATGKATPSMTIEGLTGRVTDMAVMPSK